MTSSEEQDNNIKWLKDFLSRPLSLSTNADVQCFSTGKYNQKQFNQAHFFISLKYATSLTKNSFIMMKVKYQKLLLTT